MKRLFALLAFIAIAGCDRTPFSMEDVSEELDVLMANSETIGKAVEGMTPDHRLVITREPEIIASFDNPALQHLYSQKTRQDLGEGWVLYTAIPHALLQDLSYIAADGGQEPEPDCVVDDIENIPWYAVGSRWTAFLQCMKSVADERCGGLIHASYAADPVVDDQGTEGEEDDHYDMHGFITCRTPN